MSNRYQPGDILIKKENAGFVGQKLKVRIPTLEVFNSHGFPYADLQEDHGSCFMNCGDDNCVEYANLEVLNEQNSHEGWVCHISECQLEKI